MKKILLFITLIVFTITQAQIVNIPDVNFKNALLNYSRIIDTNNDGEIQVSEAENVTGLDVSNKNISDLTGIEAFVNIIRLFCNSNQISSLDVSNNISLTTLYCKINQISSLDLSNNINLTELQCSINQISSLDISHCPNLYRLFCNYNQLSSLNVYNNINLNEIQCYNNFLTDLDLSNNLNLGYLFCGDNQFSNLDLSNNADLLFLYCKNNVLSNINLSNNPALYSFRCENNQLTYLDLSNTSIVGCYCKNNPNLEYINLKNGYNNIFSTDYNSNFEDLPNLQTVCVDEVNTDLTNFILTGTGHYVAFTTNCSTLNITDNEFLTFSLFPIPTENILNIKSETKIAKVEIYSKLGQKIKDVTENKVDISNLTQGIYFIKVEDVNGNFGVKKIIKK